MTGHIKLAVGAALAAAMATLAPSAASALPVATEGAISRAAPGVEKAGLVCDDWGRCWRTAPSYYGGGWGPGPYYGGGWRPRPCVPRQSNLARDYLRPFITLKEVLIS